MTYRGSAFSTITRFVGDETAADADDEILVSQDGVSLAFAYNVTFAQLRTQDIPARFKWLRTGGVSSQASSRNSHNDCDSRSMVTDCPRRIGLNPTPTQTNSNSDPTPLGLRPRLQPTSTPTPTPTPTPTRPNPDPTQPRPTPTRSTPTPTRLQHNPTQHDPTQHRLQPNADATPNRLQRQRRPRHQPDPTPTQTRRRSTPTPTPTHANTDSTPSPPHDNANATPTRSNTTPTPTQPDTTQHQHQSDSNSNSNPPPTPTNPDRRKSTPTRLRPQLRHRRHLQPNSTPDATRLQTLLRSLVNLIARSKSRLATKFHQRVIIKGKTLRRSLLAPWSFHGG